MLAPLPPGTFCTATKDHETWSYVPLAACQSPEAVREMVLTKLQIQDDEFSWCEFYQTRMANTQPDRRLVDDEDLWEQCAKHGSQGYLVFVQMRHQGAPKVDSLPAGASAAQGGRAGQSPIYPAGTSRGPSGGLSRRKSASTSSKSDTSSPFSPMTGPGGEGGGVQTSPLMNEFGESIGPGSHSGSGGRTQSYGREYGHRHSGSQSSIGGGGGVAYSPPTSRLPPIAPTPTHSQDDYVWVDNPHQNAQSMRRPSMPQLEPMRMGPPPPMPPPSQQVIMTQNGAVRRLPGPPQPPPSQQQQQYPYSPIDYEQAPPDRRQRTQTAPGSSNVGGGPPPPMPPSSAGWARPTSAHYAQPPLSQQGVRPLPSNPGFNIVATPSSQYHNLALQDRADAMRNYHNPPPPSPQQQQPTYFTSPPNLGPPRQVTVAKSADNLREHYAHAFDSDLRPKPPLPPPFPPQYRPQPTGYPGGPPRPPQYPQPPPSQQYSSQNYGPPPSNRGPPMPRQPPLPPQQQPQSPYSPYSPAGQQYKAFDISVMRPSGPPSSPGGSHPVPVRKNARPRTSEGSYASSPTGNWPLQQQQQPSHGPSPPRRLTNEWNEWSPHPQDRGTYSTGGRFPPPIPDVSAGIPLHPGETLQHATVARHPSPTSPNHSRPPPSAQLMQPKDPWALAEEQRAKEMLRSSEGMRRTQSSTPYESEPAPSSRRELNSSEGARRQSDSSTSTSRDRRSSRESVPTSLQPGRNERDSGSSVGSLGWPTRAPRSSDGGGVGAYDGIQDSDAAGVYHSPSSSASARSSGTGPVTPVSNHVQPTRLSDEQYAQKAEQQERMRLSGGSNDVLGDPWSQFVQGALGGEDSGTITAMSEGTIKPPRTPTSATSTAPSPAAEPTSLPPFSQDDESDEEMNTYLPNLGPKKLPPPTPLRISLSDSPKSRSPSERRPQLPHLIIDPTIPTSSPPSDAPPSSSASESERPISASAPASSSSAAPSRSRRGPSPHPVRERNQHLGSHGLSANNSPIARSASFADREKRKSDWAFRPKVEDVLENLEVFFPKHELDKEVFDTPVQAPATPSPTASPTASPAYHLARESQEAAGPSPLKRVSGATGLGYKKSIRVVARVARNRNMLKPSGREKQPAGESASGVMRRKSTKLFGSRLEEVTPAQMKQMDVDTIPEAPGDDPENFSFKWIKGELIGRGSYGKVYIAFNVTAGEAIAVKQVELPNTVSDKENSRIQGMVASLKAEIELLKDLAHDNIVEYLGMEETPEHLSIFLEYVPGGSVGRMIRTHGKFPEDVIKHFTFQILTGLRYLHGLGILHRDLKGDNILCDQDGVCKISDFGTSKKSTDIYSNDANMSMQGSIFWMAPEVIKNDQRGYSAKADIWSLGCLCLEMFAGRRPWDQNQAIEAMLKIGAERRAPPVPEDVILSELSKAFFSACFQGDPDLRPRADQLMRHRFLELGPDYSFSKTTLYHAIASKGDEHVTPSP
ncbi:hypothetical protein RQP46_002022 [Phenoliferia psychrophenolica]